MAGSAPTAAAQSARLQRTVGDEDCAICCDALATKPCIRLAGCTHVLHLNCYMRFTAYDGARGTASRCPLCRASLIVEQRTEGTGVFASPVQPRRESPSGCRSPRDVMAECLLRWVRERQGHAEPPVPATHRAREDRVRALERERGLEPILSEGSRAWRHAASHASLLAGGPGAHAISQADALTETASELALPFRRDHRPQLDALGRDRERQRAERELDRQALEAAAKRERKRKQDEQIEAERDRKRLRAQIAADRRERRAN